jgi:hypothetical protein
MASALAKTNIKTIRVKSKKKMPEPAPEPAPEPEHASCIPIIPGLDEEVSLFEAEAREEVNPYCDPELFVKRQINRTLTIPFYKITKGVNITQLLRTELAKSVEGRCSVEGYISPNSISICSHSCGTLSAANIHFNITADCLICFPDEHTVIKCVAKTINQAGIRAGARYLQSGHVSPIEVFLSRDMNIQMRELFSRIEENDILTVEIIGRRFVLHDTHVTIIAMLIDAVSP